MGENQKACNIITEEYLLGEIKKKVKEAFKQKKSRETQQFRELQQYLRKIKKIPDLSLYEEKRLWRKLKEKGGNKVVEEKIIKAKLKALIPVAENYKDNIYLTFQEILIKGEEGLREALKLLRWRKGIEEDFLKRALWWVKKALFLAKLRKRNNY